MNKDEYINEIPLPGFVKLCDEAIIPKYQTKGSVGLDLHSIVTTTLEPGEIKLVGTGLQFISPEGCEGQVRPRSGLAAKSGITVLNTPGTIDEDYRGEVKVILYNVSDSTFSIEKGDRIAQLVVCPIVRLHGYTLDNTREDKGFGSTGKV